MAEKRPFWPIFCAKKSPKSLIFFFRTWDILFLRLPLLRKIKVSLLERKNEILTETPLLRAPPQVRDKLVWADKGTEHDTLA